MPNSLPPPNEEMLKELTFRQELAQLLNKHGRENSSGTPDIILANYLARCLDTYDQTVIEREQWYGRSVNGGSSV